MALLIAIALALAVVIAFDVLAARYGADSRPRIGDDRIPGISPHAF